MNLMQLLGKGTLVNDFICVSVCFGVLDVHVSIGSLFLKKVSSLACQSPDPRK